MSKLDIIKGGAEFVVSMGVASIVANAIKRSIDPSAGKYKKLAIGIGGVVLSAMVSDMAGDYTNRQIDDTAATIKKVFRKATRRYDTENNTDDVTEVVAEDSQEVAIAPVKAKTTKAKATKDEDETA